MNYTNQDAKNHPLVHAYLDARDALQAAVNAQWCYLNLTEFAELHRVASLVRDLRGEAEQAVYDAGLAFAPYWYVTVAQMKAYAKNGTPEQREIWGA